MLETCPLHDVPNYMNDCAEVLNEEWRRSLTARLHSLEKSRDNFPLCLVLLLKEDSGETHVIGHSRLSDIRGQPTKSCLVESVVIKKSHRGKGYGRVIMEKTEEYATGKGYQMMYLTTHDKQHFYEHLGYDYCQPILSFGSDILPEHLTQKLIGNLNIKDNQAVKDVSKNNGELNVKSGVNLKERTESDCLNDTTLPVKDTLPAPQLVPLPPPPPPPPVSASIHKTEGNDTVVRWDPAKVSWMKKTLTS